MLDGISFGESLFFSVLVDPELRQIATDRSLNSVSFSRSATICLFILVTQWDEKKISLEFDFRFSTTQS